MNDINIPIVVVTYNREKSLERLLESLSKAYYDNESIELIISIDKSNNAKIYKIADEFDWKFGKKNVIKHDNNLGLRKHILKCGDLTSENDAVIILEDDLVVSRSFYKFAKQSYQYYKNEESIAGISLYTYKVNEFSNLRPFIPLQDECDVYFAMVPSSWGQMWTRNQWIKFRSWYGNGDKDLNDFRGLAPDEVLTWKESSWKKFFHFYLADQKKYFVYPRIALSTNMGDKGTNNIINSNAHQSLLMGDFRRDFIFKKLEDSTSVKYDAFFENQNIIEKLYKYSNEIDIDYYGTKEKYYKSGYCLSVNRLNYEIVAKWGLELVPYENNIEYGISGEGIFLYDLTKPYKVNKKSRTVSLIKYENPSMTKKKALRLCLSGYTEAIIRRLKLR